VLDAIPGIGATFGVIIISSLVFVTQGPWTALSVVVVSIVLQQIQDNLIHPKVMGKALNINPVVIFFALFIGERVAGLLGVFLAIPIAGMIVSWSSEQRPSPTDPTDHTQTFKTLTHHRQQQPQRRTDSAETNALNRIPSISQTLGKQQPRPASTNLNALPESHTTLDLGGRRFGFGIEPGGVGVDLIADHHVVIVGFTFPAANRAVTGGANMAGVEGLGGGSRHCHPP